MKHADGMYSGGCGSRDVDLDDDAKTTGNQAKEKTLALKLNRIEFAFSI